MSTIVTRSGKGSPLTHTEVDNNFTNLNTDKLQSGNTAASLTITSADINGGTIDGTSVGATTASTGAFTTLSASSTATLNTLSSSGATITGGSINGTTIGASTASTGAFTTLSATGVTTVSAGSVSAPAITTSGDTNTGIFFPAADTIAFAEGGAEVARFDSSGNFGIGTTSPVAKLGIQSSADGSDSIRIRSAKGNAVDGLYGTIIFNSSTSSSFDVNGASISSGSVYIDAGDLRFSTSNGGSRTERMRIDTSGNVGIGTSSPAAKLDVQGSTPLSLSTSYGTIVARNVSTTGQELHIRPNAGKNGYLSFTENAVADVYVVGVDAGVNALLFKSGSATSNTERMRIDSSGNLLLQTNSVYLRLKTGSTNFDISAQAGANDFLRISTNSTQRFQFNDLGAAYNSTGTWGTISDARLKENIVDATSKLDKVNQLRVVNFNLKSDPDVKQIGFIAQEMEEVFPSLVQEGEEDGEGGYFKAVKTTVLIPILVKAIQEQQAIITEQSLALQDLKSRITALESK
jgi:hypothetical protein